MSEDPFKKAIKQIAKTDEELSEQRDGLWKKWHSNPTHENAKLLDDFDHEKRLLLKDVLAEYDEVQENQKQKLQQLFDSIPLEYAENPKAVLGYEFYRFGTKKEWVEFLKKFEEVLKE